MEDANRQITFFGPMPTRAVQRTVQRLLENWIERKKGFHSIDKESRYEAQFEYSPTDKRWFCLVRIQIGACTWECHEDGRSIHESLCLALKHPTVSFTRLDAKVKYFSSATEIVNVA